MSLLSSCSSLKEPVPDFSRPGDYSAVVDFMSRYIKKEIKKARLTGLSVAMLDDQELIWSEGFGFADKQNKIAATPSTVYRAGSVSKLFTALAVMQLHEKNKLNIDAPLVDSVPDFSLNARVGTTDEITLRNTLAHHAGIPSAIVDGMWSKQPASFRSLPAQLQKYYTASEPNQFFAYSNVGYTLAGLAVENASKQDFIDYVQLNILDTLGMDNSNFSLKMDHPQASKSYWNGREVEELGLRDLPAGGLVTNVEDMTAFVKMIHAHGSSQGHSLLQQHSLNEMLAAQRFNNPYGLNTSIGIGWFHFPGFLNHHHLVVGHGGQTMAHSAFVATVPDLKLGIALLANSPSTEGNLEKIAQQFFRLAYPVKTGQMLAMAAPANSSELPGQSTSLVGQYISELGLTEISDSNDGYDVRMLGRKFSLHGDNENGYKLKYRLFGFIPINAGSLSDINIFARTVDQETIIVGSDKGVLGLLASPLLQDDEYPAWQQRTGYYQLENPIDTDIPFFSIDGLSLLRLPNTYVLQFHQGKMKPRLPIRIVNDSQAVIQGTGRGLGETVFADDDTIVHAGMRFIRVNAHQ